MIKAKSDTASMPVQASLTAIEPSEEASGCASSSSFVFFAMRNAPITLQTSEVKIANFRKLGL